MVEKETSKVSNPRPNKLRVTATSLLLCSLAIGASFVLKRGQPERLIEFGVSAPVGKICDGNLVWDSSTAGAQPPPVSASGLNSQPVSKLLERPVTGGPERVLANYEPELIATSPERIGLSATDIYYGLAPRPTTQGALGLIGPDRSTTLRYLGTFAAPSVRDPAIESTIVSHVTRRIDEPRNQTVKIRRAPITGGRSQDVCELDGARVFLFGTRVMWLRLHRYNTTTIKRNIDYWQETSERNDVMWKDLETGAERCIRSGPTRYLIPGGSGAMWLEMRRFPNTARDLHYVRAADGASYQIGPVRQDEFIHWFDELNGTLYWIVQEGVAGGSVRLMMEQLGSTNSQRIADIQLPDHETGYRDNMFAWHGNIYCLISHDSLTPGQSETSLVRVHPGSSTYLETVRTLPINILPLGIDAGYLYFILSEMQPSIRERITGDDPAGPRVQTLCRITLPD